ncbi:XRE family transcriptional regulator [Nitratireductor aquimarinus]|uniref:helix-turn-helix domain-containing protein n=1 Tax=Nitratireductor aquimarinus TaxID=889300 RepID=UPI0029369659|nr:XRE family transcriptional regulator [Nitratireductor aquimarinus]MDV2968861.1 XRE family transcriptional regulator [Nitratireductor aquimarinus]
MPARKTAAEPKPAPEASLHSEADGQNGSPIGSAIRKRRKALGRTLNEVAQAAELTIGFISQVERNISSPSISSLLAIADALDTSVEELVRVKEEFREYIPGDRRQTYAIGPDNRLYEKLGPGFSGALFYPLLIHRPPGHESEHMCHPGEVFCYLMAGEMEYHLDGEIFRMTAGDTIHHNTEKPHFSRVTGDSETTELWVSTTPSRTLSRSLNISLR